jgi:uncharacterized membrane protein YoaK (UPF0700 family)
MHKILLLGLALAAGYVDALSYLGLGRVFETLILAAFGFGWELSGARSQLATDVLIVLSAVAMGVQSAAVHRLEVSGITTTYITGTLTHLVAGVMGRERRKNRPVPARARLLGAVWLVYIGGAVAGAAALAGDRTINVALPAVLIAAVAAAATARPPTA